jgi:succinoglycan biosynthesis protein ExoA
MKISTIIPCRNEKNYVTGFLDSVLDQELETGWEMEILVADGLSDDGTRDVLRQYMQTAPNVRMIDNPGRIVSTGLNAAIAAASGEVVIRMDAHTVYAPDYVRRCVEALRESGADNVGGPWVAEGRGALGLAIAAAFRSRFCTGGGKAHDPGYEGEVDTVYLGCWSRAVFERVGLFDPELVRNQDDEFNFRLRRAGGRIWQSPRIRSSYAPRASLRALFRQYLQYGFWKVAVIRKHRALASWRHVVPALFVASIVAWAAALAAGLVWRMPAVSSASAVGLSAELAFYLLACVAASAEFAGSLDLPALLLLPAVMAVHHVAYGLGFLIALLRRSPHGPPAQAAPWFTALTR